MASLTETSLRRPVAVTMAFLIVITLGVVGLRRPRRNWKGTAQVAVQWEHSPAVTRPKAWGR